MINNASIISKDKIHVLRPISGGDRVRMASGTNSFHLGATFWTCNFIMPSSAIHAVITHL